MEFDNSFFEDEIRCGFLVPTILKRGWAAGMVVLSDIDRICKENNISYFVEWGTLLGAIRHDGFIPWDDDIDIAMTRPNYEKFLRVAPKQLPANYVIHNIYSDDMFTPTLTCVLNSDKVCTDDDFLEKYQGCPAPIGVDIVVHDYFPRNKEDQEQLFEALNFIVSLRAQYNDLSEQDKKEQLQLVKDVLGVKIDTNSKDSVTKQLGLLIENICGMYSKKDADEYVNMIYYERSHKCHFPMDWIDNTENHQFENIQVPVPREYDKYLTLLFGDYHKWIKNGSAHTFPYFEDNYRVGYRAMGVPGYVPTSMPLPRKEKLNVSPLYLFIVSRAKYWAEMASVYEEVCRRYTNADIYVMPVPYFVKDIAGNAVEMCYEGNDYPEDLKLVDYSQYDLAELHPDRIYFQDPCDEWNETVQLPEEYCSQKLSECSELLIYVPYNLQDKLEENDGASRKMLMMSVQYPGVIMADRIIVPDELKGDYLDILKEYTGQATEGVWKEKLYIV